MTTTWIVIGIAIPSALAIVFFILTIRNANRNKRAPGLLYAQKDCVALFDSIVKNMDKIEILYNAEPITPDLILLKGCFYNSGNDDLESSKIHRPVSADFGENVEVIECNISEKPDGSNVKKKIVDNQKIEFNWDLLKKTESFHFDILLKVKKKNGEKEKERVEKRLFKEIVFTHRITDLDKIDKAIFSSRRSSTKTQKNMFLGMMVLQSALLISLAVFFFVLQTHDLRFSYSDDTYENIEVKVRALTKDTISMRGLNEDFKKVVVLDDLISTRNNLKPIITIDKTERRLYWILLLMITGMLGFYSYFYFKEQRSIKRYKLIFGRKALDKTST